jgi:protein TonB
MDYVSHCILTLNTLAMTNNEILRASLLDIIFENRNKSYGAYALRRTYNSRLVIAMIAASVSILLFLLLTSMGKRNQVLISRDKQINDTVILRSVELPRNVPVEQPQPQPQRPRSTQPVASAQFLSNIDIVPDDKLKAKLPSFADLDNKVISDTTTGGLPAGWKPQVPSTTGNGTNPSNSSTTIQKDFIPDEQPAEYPGGDRALNQFLSRNLSTPDELEPGDKKTVMVKFKVDADGTVSQFEIVVSGGQEFDKEVLRVCRKMGRWKPARQNGFPVAVSFQVPVTFIGLEQ